MGPPGGPVVRSALQNRGLGFQSLVGDLRSVCHGSNYGCAITACPLQLQSLLLTMKITNAATKDPTQPNKYSKTNQKLNYPLFEIM